VIEQLSSAETSAVGLNYNRWLQSHSFFIHKKTFPNLLISAAVFPVRPGPTDKAGNELFQLLLTFHLLLPHSNKIFIRIVCVLSSGDRVKV